LTAGTVVSITSAIWSYESASISRSSQRRALRLRQVLHVGDQEPELLALVDLVGRRQPTLGQVDGPSSPSRPPARGAGGLSERLRGPIRYSHPAAR